jgi:hypothetical protein
MDIVKMENAIAGMDSQVLIVNLRLNSNVQMNVQIMGLV